MAAPTIDSPLTPDEIARRLDVFVNGSDVAEPVWKRLTPAGVAYSGRCDATGFTISHLRNSYQPPVELRGTFSGIDGGTRVTLKITRGRARRIAAIAIFGFFIPLVVLVACVGAAENIPLSEIASVAVPLLIMVGLSFTMTRLLPDPAQDIASLRLLLTLPAADAIAEADRKMMREAAEMLPARAGTKLGSFTVSTPLPVEEVVRRLELLVTGNRIYSDIRTVYRPQYVGVVSPGGFRMHRAQKLDRNPVLDGSIAADERRTTLSVDARIDRWAPGSLARAIGTGVVIGMFTGGLQHPIRLVATVLVVAALDLALIRITMRERVKRERLFLEKVMDSATGSVAVSGPVRRPAATGA